MRGFWIKIGLGALGVFLVGMMLVTVGREAKATATEALAGVLERGATVSSVASAPSDLPFRLAGDRLGTVRHLSIRREASGALARVELAVELNSEAAASRLADCVLIAEHERNFDFDSGFRCAHGSSADLVELGHAGFTPGDFDRPIMVSERMAEDMRDGDPFEATADIGGEVRVTARGDGGNLVRILADHHGQVSRSTTSWVGRSCASSPIATGRTSGCATRTGAT